ncbi:alanine--tRNA ligase [Patescibacteria group bacterium]
MTSNELREKYLNFFKEKGHAVIPSASLIPDNDPTTLFISAGMHPLVPYLLGEKHPEGNRLADVQKCIRTIDIEEVGDYCHHTFFEMLGNWSLGDYFKKEAIEWSWEFLTDKKWLGLEPEKLAFSVFKGDKDAPFDEEAYELWKKIGIPETRIAKLGKEDNWWGPAGKTGPCGPDTEMFYWVDDKSPAPEKFDPENKKWVEVWNNVFMQYNKTVDGKYEKLKQENVDTGMGLERTLAVVNGLDDDYATELFKNSINKIEELSKLEYGNKSDSDYIKEGEHCWIDARKQIRIIADHIKAAVFIMGDDLGIAPSNLDQGYIVRRLVRRAVRSGKKIGIEKTSWTTDVATVIISDFGGTYPELENNSQFIIHNLENEEKKFKQTLERGEKELLKFKGSEVTGSDVFNWYQTYGYPIEMTEEAVQEKGLTFSDGYKKEFEKELQKHQELSRTATEGKFKSGLADNSEQTTKYHTATHLLLASLRKVLGNHVSQKGSNITPERIRFDFSHGEKMTDEEKQQVEELVNDAIKKDIPVVCEEMTLDEAKEKNITGVFEHKYGEKVKTYSIGSVSREICGGPHVERTGVLGDFKIKKESSSSAGVRRIKAVLE